VAGRRDTEPIEVGIAQIGELPEENVLFGARVTSQLYARTLDVPR
jgi:hypothetical protein